MKRRHLWLIGLIPLAVLLIPLGLALADDNDDDSDAAEEKSPLYTRRHVTSIPRVGDGPNVDGRGGDAAWRSAKAVDLHIPGTDEQEPEESITASICRDSETVYVLFDIPGPTLGNVAASELATRPLEERDSMELIIDLGADARTYHRFIVTYENEAKGSAYLQGGKVTNIAWDGEWQSATAKTAEGWSAELAIPWDSLGLAPRDGTMLGINFICHQPEGAGTVAWHGGLADFRHPALCGLAAFGADWEPDRPKLHILEISKAGNECSVLVEAVGRAFPSSNFGLTYRLTVPGQAPVESIAAMNLRNNKTAEVRIGPVPITEEGPASLVLMCKRRDKIIKALAVSFPVAPAGG